MTRFGDSRTRTLMAVIELHQVYGRVTVREVAERVGISVASCHRQLRLLRRDGFVDWQDGMSATLHPLYEVRVPGLGEYPGC